MLIFLADNIYVDPTKIVALRPASHGNDDTMILVEVGDEAVEIPFVRGEKTIDNLAYEINRATAHFRE